MHLYFAAYATFCICNPLQKLTSYLDVIGMELSLFWFVRWEVTVCTCIYCPLSVFYLALVVYKVSQVATGIFCSVYDQKQMM